MINNCRGSCRQEEESIIELELNLEEDTPPCPPCNATPSGIKRNARQATEEKGILVNQWTEMPLIDEFSNECQQMSPQKEPWNFDEYEGSQVSDLLENNVFSPLFDEKFTIPGLKVVKDEEIKDIEDLFNRECDKNLLQFNNKDSNNQNFDKELATNRNTSVTIIPESLYSINIVTFRCNLKTNLRFGRRMLKWDNSLQKRYLS
jgi:hypothetical protein